MEGDLEPSLGRLLHFGIVLLDKGVGLWYNVYMEGESMWWASAVGFLVGTVVGGVVTLRLCSRLGSIEYAIRRVAVESNPLR